MYVWMAVHLAYLSANHMSERPHGERLHLSCNLKYVSIIVSQFHMGGATASLVSGWAVLVYIFTSHIVGQVSAHQSNGMRSGMMAFGSSGPNVFALSFNTMIAFE